MSRSSLKLPQVGPVGVLKNIYLHSNKFNSFAEVYTQVKGKGGEELIFRTLPGLLKANLSKSIFYI